MEKLTTVGYKFLDDEFESGTLVRFKSLQPTFEEIKSEKVSVTAPIFAT